MYLGLQEKQQSWFASIGFDMLHTLLMRLFLALKNGVAQATQLPGVISENRFHTLPL